MEPVNQHEAANQIPKPNAKKVLARLDKAFDENESIWLTYVEICALLNYQMELKDKVDMLSQYMNRSADQPAPNHNTSRLAQLTQLSHGPVHASNLLSSIDRDALVRIGWAFRAGEGWNCITPEGLMICVNLGILRTA